MDRSPLFMLCTATLCVALLAGCGTSTGPSAEESIPEAGSWMEFDLSPSPEHPSPDTVLPKLDLPQSSYEDGTDVTEEYESLFWGIWDSEDGARTYEFRGNDNLIVTDSSGNTYTYTYWVTDTGKQVHLCIFQNGQETATAYSFTQKGNNLTLYDTSTGNAVELLIRRVTVQETTTPAPTKTPSYSATPAPTSTPAAPSPSPSPEPSPDPSTEPSPWPSPSPSPSIEPSPSPSPEPDLPAEVQAAVPAIECALDVIRSGGSFSSSDGSSFWSIMARYAARSGYPTEDGYVVLTPDEMLSCAAQVFAEFDTLPEIPEGSTLVIHDLADEEAGTEEQYRLLQGQLGNIDIATMEYDGNGTLLVAIRDDGNAFDYEVVLSGSAIVSITAK